jgi:hypothetical protein
MSTIVFYAQFKASKTGKTGLSPTIDIRRLKRSDSTASTVQTAASMTEWWKGLYYYVLSGADLDTYDYLAVAITADSTVDDQQIPAVWARFAETTASFADPLTNAVPGSYVSGTAGAKLGLIGTASISITSPVAVAGSTINIVRGDGYYSADGRALEFTDSGSTWPSLTSASAFVVIDGNAVLLTGSIIDAATIHVQMTEAQSGLLSVGEHNYHLYVLLANGHTVTLARGIIYAS